MAHWTKSEGGKRLDRMTVNWLEPAVDDGKLNEGSRCTAVVDSGRSTDRNGSDATRPEVASAVRRAQRPDLLKQAITTTFGATYLHEPHFK